MSRPTFLHSMALDGAGGGTQTDVAEWSEGQGPIWLHFDIADAECANWLRNSSGLRHYAIDALLAEETRPQSAVFDDGLLVVLRGVNLNPGEDPEDMVSIRVWIESDRIISTRRRPLMSVQDLVRSIDEGAGPKTASEFLPAIVERIADRIGAFVETIETNLDQAEETAAHAPVLEVRSQLATIRRQNASVRRFLAPQRDALDRLNRQSSKFLDDRDQHALRQEADRITRNLEDLDLAKERAIVLQELLLGQIAQEQNSRMYVLSVVAAIFLPLTFISGVLGMNVGGLPGLDSEWGFVGSLILMLVAAIALVIVFRRKKWL